MITTVPLWTVSPSPRHHTCSHLICKCQWVHGRKRAQQYDELTHSGEQEQHELTMIWRCTMNGYILARNWEFIFSFGEVPGEAGFGHSFGTPWEASRSSVHTAQAANQAHNVHPLAVQSNLVLQSRTQLGVHNLGKLDSAHFTSTQFRDNASWAVYEAKKSCQMKHPPGLKATAS